MNQSYMNRVKQEKYFDHLNSNKKTSTLKHWFWKSDRWRYGDLYGLCFLPKYKQELAPFKSYATNAEALSSNKVLYIIGDSFLADKILNKAFDKFDQVIFLDRRFKIDPIKLDSTKENYLILEIAERNLNNYGLGRKNEIRWSDDEIKNGFIQKEYESSILQTKQASIFDRLDKILFNKDLSKNIELLLFDNKFATIFKEQKARLNYSLTGRVAKEVAISRNGERLFLNSTVDTNFKESAFRMLSDKEVSDLSQLLAEDNNYYQKIGFKHTFLSIIPNPVSIYDSKRMKYNRLLERLEEKTKLTKISLLKIFKKEKRNVIYLSDSHWNPLGLDLWVNETNVTLNNWVN